MKSKKIKVTAYELGKGFGTTKEGAPLYSWPYMLHYTPGHRTGDFYVSEGDARNGGGTFISAAELLKIDWKGHLGLAEVAWLVPLLERIANEETIAPSQVFEAYKQQHGKLPPGEEWDVWS